MSEPQHYYVARQRIFDQNLDTVGFELLYRSGPTSTTAATTVDPDETTRLAMQAAEKIGWDVVAEGHDVWLNGYNGLIKGEVPINLPPSQTVIEVLETVEPTAEVVDGIVSHAFAGRRVALDDFAFGPHANRLLDVAAVVKLDLKMFDLVGLANRVLQCKRAHLLVLAEKVETAGELNFCQALGCDLFQGYYLARPEIMSTDPTLSASPTPASSPAVS